MIGVVNSAINVMQVRIARSRLAGEPADVLVTPRLSKLGLLDYHRGAIAIEEGRAALQRALQAAGVPVVVAADSRQLIELTCQRLDEERISWRAIIGGLIIGMDARSIEQVLARLRQHAGSNGPAGTFSFAQAAIDIALWDLAGKHYGARVCDLLGGATRESVPSYYAVGVMDPDESARQAKEKLREGYPRLQIKVGARPIEEDIAVIRKVGEIMPKGARLAIDANRGWTLRDMIFVSNQCRDVDFIMEQPLNTMEEIAIARPLVNHPLYLDESTQDLGAVIRAIGSGICDGFGLKVTRLGGLSVMRTVRELCAVRSLPHTCDDAWGGDIIAAACVVITLGLFCTYYYLLSNGNLFLTSKGIIYDFQHTDDSFSIDNGSFFPRAYRKRGIGQG